VRNALHPDFAYIIDVFCHQLRDQKQEQYYARFITHIVDIDRREPLSSLWLRDQASGVTG
jgi:fructose-1,6-bisphosphatase